MQTFACRHPTSHCRRESRAPSHASERFGAVLDERKPAAFGQMQLGGDPTNRPRCRREPAANEVGIARSQKGTAEVVFARSGWIGNVALADVDHALADSRVGGDA